jgi:hypothetical protein
VHYMRRRSHWIPAHDLKLAQKLGSLPMFAAMRRASSRVSSLAARTLPRNRHRRAPGPRRHRSPRGAHSAQTNAERATGRSGYKFPLWGYITPSFFPGKMAKIPARDRLRRTKFLHNSAIISPATVSSCCASNGRKRWPSEKFDLIREFSRNC